MLVFMAYVFMGFKTNGRFYNAARSLGHDTTTVKDIMTFQTSNLQGTP